MRNTCLNCGTCQHWQRIDETRNGLCLSAGPAMPATITPEGHTSQGDRCSDWQPGGPVELNKRWGREKLYFIDPDSVPNDRFYLMLRLFN